MVNNMVPSIIEDFQNLDLNGKKGGNEKNNIKNGSVQPIQWYKMKDGDSASMKKQVTVDAVPGHPDYDHYGKLKVMVPSHLSKFKLRPKHFGPKVVFFRS